MTTDNENQLEEQIAPIDFQRVIALVDEYLIFSALEIRHQDVTFWSDELIEIRSILNPEIKKVEDEISRLENKLRGLLPEDGEGRKCSGKLSDLTIDQLNIYSDASFLTGMISGMRLAHASNDDMSRFCTVLNQRGRL